MAKQPATADPKPTQTTAETVSADDVKARIKAITGDDAAKGHEGLAQHLAFNTDMPAEDAIGALKAAASEAPATDEPADPKGYQASRSAAAALAQPGGGGGAPKKEAKTIDTRGIYAKRNARKGA